MIIVEGKIMTYSQACHKLEALTADLEEARDELSACEDKEIELEGEICSLKSEVDHILEQIKAKDMTNFLPTSLYMRGYKLLEVIPAGALKGQGLWGEVSSNLRHTILESPGGEVLVIWPVCPSLSDLMDAAIEYAA